ncbi:MAG: hypothetical protein ACFE9C_04740 [Candidatus Hodarchaeota archaeon]
MNYRVLDAKLKNLIHICKETENYKKLAVVNFILTSNRINEIGINLGLRPRNKSSGEKIYEYMELINEIFEENLKIPIFRSSSIETVRACETLFLKNRGNIPLEYIRQMFSLYYELRKLEVPNLHKALDEEIIMESSKFGAFSFLSSGNRKKSKDADTLKPLILQKIAEKERNLRKNLQHELNAPRLETAIHLHSIKNSLANDKKGKIIIHGALKDNLNYRKSLESIYGYMLIGVIILFVSLGIIILIEMSALSIYSSDLSTFLLFMVGSAVILIYYYIKKYRKVK